MIENALIRQVLSLPELIEQQYNDLEPKASKPRQRNFSASVKNGAFPSSPSSIKSTTSAATPSTSWMKSKTFWASTPIP